MRLLKMTFLLALSVFSLTCSQSGGRPAPFFMSSFDVDSRIDSLSRRVGYMQSKLGFEIHDFEFATRSDEKLIATLRAEFKGELVPELSGVYHIPPTRNNPQERGSISINFFYPQYKTQNPQPPTWELTFSTSGVSLTSTVTSPFVPIPPLNRGLSSSQGLIDDHEQKVWEYEIEPNESGQGRFKYTLTVRLKKVESGEDLSRIRKEDLPEAAK